MDHLFEHVVTIERSTVVVDGAQIKPTALASAVTGVACLIQEEFGRTVDTEAGKQIDVSATVFFGPGESVQPKSTTDAGDVLLVTTHPRLNGTRYRVIHVSDPSGGSSGYGDHLEAKVSLVR